MGPAAAVPIITATAIGIGQGIIGNSSRPSSPPRKKFQIFKTFNIG